MPFDALLPVAPGSLYGRDFYGRHWRDIPQSEPLIITAPAFEPLSRAEAKLHVRSTLTDEDPWIDSVIMAARMQVEADNGRTLPRTQLEMTFDQFPLERWIPLPRPPLVSIDKVSSFDMLTETETTFDPSNYDVDTYSHPGRIQLKLGKIWPVGVRWFSGGKIRWTAGYTGIPQAVTSITSAAGVATVTMTGAHGWATGNQIAIAGADQADYNGTFQITVTGAATFTYPVANAPTSPATGVITSATFGIPARRLHMMKLLIGNWDTNRDAGGVMRGTADLFPLGYDALNSDSLQSLG
jgi:uncharacterized phiE125 gp8 family phage protein